MRHALGYKEQICIWYNLETSLVFFTPSHVIGSEPAEYREITNPTNSDSHMSLCNDCVSDGSLKYDILCGITRLFGVWPWESRAAVHDPENSTSFFWHVD